VIILPRLGGRLNGREVGQTAKEKGREVCPPRVDPHRKKLCQRGVREVSQGRRKEPRLIGTRFGGEKPASKIRHFVPENRPVRGPEGQEENFTLKETKQSEIMRKKERKKRVTENRTIPAQRDGPKGGKGGERTHPE